MTERTPIKSISHKLLATTRRTKPHPSPEKRGSQQPSTLALGRIQVSVSYHSGYPETTALLERTIFLEGSISADDRLRLLEPAQRTPVDLNLRGGAGIRTILSTDNCLAASPANSDYLSDISQAVAVPQDAFSRGLKTIGGPEEANNGFRTDA